MGRCSPLLTAVIVAAVMCVDAVRSAVSQPMDAVVSAAATKPQLTAAVVVISLLAYAWMQYRAVSRWVLWPSLLCGVGLAGTGGRERDMRARAHIPHRTRHCSSKSRSWTCRSLKVRPRGRCVLALLLPPLASGLLQPAGLPHVRTAYV